jgi:hypothetical protein
VSIETGKPRQLVRIDDFKVEIGSWDISNTKQGHYLLDQDICFYIYGLEHFITCRYHNWHMYWDFLSNETNCVIHCNGE